MDENYVEFDLAPVVVETSVKKAKKRIDLVRSNSDLSPSSTVRVSARQAERRSAKASRDNSEEKKGEESSRSLGLKVSIKKVGDDLGTNAVDRLVKEMEEITGSEIDIKDEIMENFSTRNYDRQESSSTDLLDELVMDFGDEDLDEEHDDQEPDPNLNTEDRLADDIAGEVAGELVEEAEGRVAEAEDSEPDSEPDEDYEDTEPNAESDEEYIVEKPTRRVYNYPTKPKAMKWAIKVTKDKLWKYGKLWEFIRDLLKIPRYNPSVIRWEVEDEGEFRIVDSSKVAGLWATVKGNRKMNYEKLSRAMRYYYKHKVFEIVPNKRLVYKFGSRAYNWRKQELERPGAPRVACEVQGRRRTTWRCGECLRMFQSGKEHEAHTSNCRETLQLPVDQAKKDGEKLRSHMAKRSQSPRETITGTHIKPLREKLTELKSKLKTETKTKPPAEDKKNQLLEEANRELLSLRPGNDSLDPPISKQLDSNPQPTANTSHFEKNIEETSTPQSLSPIQITITPQEDGSSPVHLTIQSPPISNITSMSTKEHDALESLMFLGTQPSEEKDKEVRVLATTSTASVVPLPLTVSDINIASAPAQTEPKTPEPFDTSCKDEPKTYLVIPNLAAFRGALQQSTSPQVPNSLPSTKPQSTAVADKISFMKSATEKTKTHTILQRREGTQPQSRLVPESVPITALNISADHSEDEIEVVKVVKPPQKMKENIGHTLWEHLTKTQLPTTVVEAGKAQVASGLDLTIPPPPSFSDPETTPRVININPKYLQIEKPISLDENIQKKKTNMQNLVEEEMTKNADNPASTPPQGQSISLGLQQIPGQATMGTLEMTPDQSSIVFMPSQSPVVESRTVPKLSAIRINPKYGGMMASNADNIVGQENKAQLQKALSPRSADILSSTTLSTSGRPMIKVNPKYQTQGLLISQLSEEFEREKASIIENGAPLTENQLKEKASVNMEKTQELQRLQEDNTNLAVRKENLDDLIVQQQMPETVCQMFHTNNSKDTSKDNQNRFKRAAEMLMPSKQVKRSRLTENLANLQKHGVAETTQVIPRRYADRIDRISGPVPSMPSFVTKDTKSLQTYSKEPLPGLWKFLRALLHNPAYNPKMVNWEILEEGMFRIHNLSEFYNLWRDLKKTEISYELLTKTLKIYDERKFLHGVYNHRCVYKFGENATDWRPSDHEIIQIGKKPVPNQATWHSSRFYGELDTLPCITLPAMSAVSPTTLFTLRPLDPSSTKLSEMTVMTDNSKIIKTNHFSTKMPPVGLLATSSPSKPEPTTTPLTIKSCTEAMAVIKIEGFDNDEIKEIKQEKKQNQFTPPEKADRDQELECKLIIPKLLEAQAVLTLPGGFKVNLERSIFKDVEAFMALKSLPNGKNIKTTIVPKDQTQFAKVGRTKVFSRKRSLHESPMSVAQMMDTIVPKKLNFILPKQSSLAPKSLGGLLTTAENISRSPFEVILPTTVLQKSPVQDRTVSLHLPEREPSSLLPSPTSSTTSSNSSGHRLPGQVAQLPSTINFTNSSPSLPSFSISVLPSTSLMPSTSYLPSSSTSLLPATVEEQNPEGSITSDDGSLAELNKNVLRCRKYRDMKKVFLQNQEEEIKELEQTNNKLLERHTHLDTSISKLQEYYLNMIRENKYKCCGENEKN